MGSIQRTSTSRYWIAYYQRWDARSGVWRRTRASTRCEDETAARAVLQGLESAALHAAGLAPGTRISPEHVQTLVVGILHAAGHLVADSGRGGLLAFVARYMQAKASTVSAGTLSAYAVHRRGFEAWHGPEAPLDRFTSARALDFYTHLRGAVSPKTCNDRFRWLSGVLDLAVAEGLLPRNPCRAVKTVAATGTVGRLPFSLPEARKLIAHLAAAPDPRAVEWSRAAALSLLTGARLADCLLLDRKAVRSSPGGPVLRYTQRKTGKPLEVPLVLPDLVALLTAVRRGPLCPLLAAEYARLGNAHLSGEFTAHVAAAGIRQSYVQARGRKIARKTFHSLRHTLRTAIVSSGGSDAQADLILGHSAGQGRTYTHTELASSRAVLLAAFQPPPPVKE